MRAKNKKARKHKASGKWYIRLYNKYIYYGNRDTPQQEADLWAASKYAMAEHQTKTAEEHEKDTPFDTLAKDYLAGREGKGGRKGQQHRIRYINDFLKTFGNKVSSAIKPHAIEAWLHSHETWGNNTKRNACRNIAAMFNWMTRNDILLRSPMKAVERPEEQLRGVEWVMTQEEYYKILDAIAVHWKDFLEVLWETGCRPGEICTMTVEEYQKDDHCIDKDAHKTAHKGQHRLIALNPRAEAIVVARIELYKESLLFRSIHGRQEDPGSFLKCFKRAMCKCGIDREISSYCIRHSMANRLFKKELPTSAIASVLGNSEKVVERYYLHGRQNVKANVALLSSL